MELQQLRYLVAVAESGNFTRASERCGVAQPSLSQQIINLERELNQKLFHRLGRRAVLTEAGTALLERSRKILFEVEDATKELSDSPSLGRRITVGAIPTVAPYLFPPLLRECAQRYPNLEICVYEDFRRSLIRGTVEGELDLAIVALPAHDPRISVESLLTEPLLLVVARNHRLAGQAHVTPRDLAEERFIMMGSSSSLAEQVRMFCGDHDFEPRIAHRCAQIATVKRLVTQGAGISILPRVARSPRDADKLDFIKLSGREPTRELAVIRHLQRYQSRGAEQFLQLLRETSGSFGMRDR